MSVSFEKCTTEDNMNESFAPVSRRIFTGTLSLPPDTDTNPSETNAPKPEKFPFPVLTASRTLLETTGRFLIGTLKAAGLGNVLPPRLNLLFSQVQSAFQCPRSWQ